MLIILSIVFVILLAFDQISKVVISNLVAGSLGATIRFIPGLIRFEYCQNTGMAWGLLPNAVWFFILLTVALAGFILFLLIRYRHSMPRLMQFALTLTLSGATGNLIDRIFLGYVRDFIAFDFFTFPVFNIADCCVTIGGALLVISLIFTKQGRIFFNDKL